MLMRVENTDIADKGDNNGEENNTTPGYVMVKGKAAADQEVARNAVNKKVGTITLTAGDNDTTVSSVVVARSGKWNATDVSVQLFNDGVAATSQKRVSKSSQEVTLKLSPAVVVKAKSSVTFDVVASLSGDVNETHTFTVKTVNVAKWTAEWTPVELWTLKTTSYLAGKVTVNSIATDSLKAGDTNKAFVTLKLSANKKWVIKWVTVTKQSGEKDLNELVNNVKAYYNDEVVGDVKVTDEKIVVSNLNIEKNAGQSITLELRGDCIYVWDEVESVLAVELNDVLAVETNADENMWNEEKVATNPFTVNGVDLTIKKMSKKEQTVVPGTSDVELLNMQVSSKAEIEINDFVVEFNQDLETLTGHFIDGVVTVWVDGEDYEMTWKRLSFGKKESFTVDASNPVTIRVTANLLEVDDADATFDPDSLDMKLTLSGAKVSDSNATISLNSLSKKWDTTKIKVAWVVVKSSSAPASDSLFGNKEQEIWRFALKASSDDVTIKTLEISLTGSAVSGEVMNELLDGNLRLVDVADDKDITADVEDVTTEWVIKFKSMNYSIKKDQTANIKVLADLGDTDDVLWKKLQLILSGWEFKTTSTAITPFDGWEKKMKEYTFKATAPVIKLNKTSEDNMIEVTIINEESYDEGITLLSLGYTVKSMSKDEFEADVCIVDDANTTTCETKDWQLGKTTVEYVFDDVNLSEDDEVTYYIVVDGENITPEVLEASIVNLKYKVWDSEEFTEKYSLKSNFR